MKIKVKKLFPKIYLLMFDTQYELCMSFVRWQEFYESPKFRGKYFDLEEYIDYWSKDFGGGSFDYPAVWGGFNIPGKVIDDWISISVEKQDRDRENEVLILLCDTLRNDNLYLRDTYIIATHKEQEEREINTTIDHELAHAFYYVYPEYKSSCNKLLKKVSKVAYTNAKVMLVKLGYCRASIKDEMQAYFSTYNEKEILTPRMDFCKNFETFKKSMGGKNDR